MSKRFGIFSVVGMLSTLYVLPVAGNDVVFNKDWRFSLHSDSTCISPSYDDHEWRKLDIPHDWSIELPLIKMLCLEMMADILKVESDGIENPFL